MQQLLPSLSAIVGLAPAARRAFAHQRFTDYTAQNNGVPPVLVDLFKSAPALISRLTVILSSLKAAHIRVVQPSKSALSISHIPAFSTYSKLARVIPRTSLCKRVNPHSSSNLGGNSSRKVSRIFGSSDPARIRF